jgi:GNAT superfamily N-acetyltransferase
LWVDGFSRLSNKSRYLRFGGTKNRLSEKDIRYLDKETHFAICAVKEDSDGNEIGIGVGRFIRSADDPTHAEPAMVFTDDAQGLGLGYLLSLRLIAAARERGVERHDANVLASNSIVLRMMKELGSDTELQRYNSETVLLLNLPAIDLIPTRRGCTCLSIAKLLGIHVHNNVVYKSFKIDACLDYVG